MNKLLFIIHLLLENSSKHLLFCLVCKVFVRCDNNNDNNSSSNLTLLVYGTSHFCWNLHLNTFAIDLIQNLVSKSFFNIDYRVPCWINIDCDARQTIFSHFQVFLGTIWSKLRQYVYLSTFAYHTSAGPFDLILICYGDLKFCGKLIIWLSIMYGTSQKANYLSRTNSRLEYQPMYGTYGASSLSMITGFIYFW